MTMKFMPGDVIKLSISTGDICVNATKFIGFANSYNPVVFRVRHQRCCFVIAVNSDEHELLILNDELIGWVRSSIFEPVIVRNDK